MNETRRKSRQAEWKAVFAAALALMAAALPALASRPGPKPLKKIASIELPGPSGKPFEALLVDSQNHRLFCAHAGAGSLYVVDLQTYGLARTISGLPGVSGVAYVPEQKKIYASIPGEDSIGVIDSETFEVMKKIPTEADPDAIAYAAPDGKLFISEGLAHAIAVIDVASDSVVKMIRFDGRAGTPQYDSASKKIYVNLPDTGQIAEIDPAANAVTARYSAGRCLENSGMALDAGRRLAFLSCEENNLLAVFDLRTNQMLAYLPMAAGGAEVALDPKLGRIYVACVSGAISVYEEKESEKCRKLNDFSAAHAVHSLAIDTTTERIYVPEQEEDGVPVSRLVVYEERP